MVYTMPPGKGAVAQTLRKNLRTVTCWALPFLLLPKLREIMFMF